MKHFRLQENYLGLWKVQERGFFKWWDVDGRVYDTLEKAEKALNELIGTMGCIVWVRRAEEE